MILRLWVTINLWPWNRIELLLLIHSVIIAIIASKNITSTIFNLINIIKIFVPTRKFNILPQIRLLVTAILRGRWFKFNQYMRGRLIVLIVVLLQLWLVATFADFMALKRTDSALLITAIDYICKIILLIWYAPSMRFKLSHLLLLLLLCEIGNQAGRHCLFLMIIQKLWRWRVLIVWEVRHFSFCSYFLLYNV